MKHEEDKIQAAVIRWMAYQHPTIARWLHHSPNGGLRSRVTAARLKGQGTRAGFPDLILPIARGGFAGLVIELKTPKGTLRPEQIEWLNHLGRQGWHASVCRGFEAARDTIAKYLELPEPAGEAQDALQGP